MPLRHHGSVSLCMECARARNHVAQAKEVEFNEEKEQILQVQACRNPTLGLSVRMQLTALPKVRKWSPPGLPKTQKMI